jgi:hypothetical protein
MGNNRREARIINFEMRQTFGKSRVSIMPDSPIFSNLLVEKPMGLTYIRLTGVTGQITLEK